MKYGLLSIVVLAFLQTAACHNHGQDHKDHVSKRDEKAFKQPCPVTATIEVVVWVDQNGQTLTVETKTASSSGSSSHATVSSSSCTSTSNTIQQPSSTHQPSISSCTPSSSSSSSSCSSSASTTSQQEQPAQPIQPAPETAYLNPNPVLPPTIPDIGQPAQFLPEATYLNPNPVLPPTIPDIGQPTQLAQYLPEATYLNPNPVLAPIVSPPASNMSKYGISYSPYRADSTCKGQSDVDKDIQAVREFGLVRFYGVDCDQARTVVQAARQVGTMRVFAGIYDLSNIDQDLQTVIEAAAGDWSIFHTVSIGNELVNKGQNTPAEVVGAVNSARQTLRAAGYQGPVVTVDTFNQLIEHPELCDASDYCAANCHAFFDATQTAETAGPYVAEQARLVSQAVRGRKSTMITESGWPYNGEPNGKAVPSRENQDVAIKGLEDSFPDGGLILFSAFDDRWKQDTAWTFATEKFWGFLHL